MTDTKNKKEKNDYLLTLRLPRTLVQRYEAIRGQYKAKGKNKSVAQIVRDDLAEQEKINTLSPKRRLDRLIGFQKNKAETLLRLRGLILKEEMLNREEWEFLCMEASNAYSIGRRSALNSALLSDVVKAFRDFIHFRDVTLKQPSAEHSYYLSNLIKPKHSDGDITYEKAIEHTLQIINKEPITTVSGMYLSRNLEICLRDEPITLPEQGIQDCFMPYAKSLMTLAAFSFYHTSRADTGRTQPYTQYMEFEWATESWSKIYEAEGLKIHVQHYFSSVTALLTVDVDWFCEMQGFTFHSLEEFCLAVLYSREVGSYQGIDNTHEGEKYCFVHFGNGGNRWCIDKAHYDRLKSLVSEIMADQEYGEIRAKAKLIYGAI